MNRKDFLKRLGLLTTTAVVSPIILAEQSQFATTKPTESVERMRIYSSGRVGMSNTQPNTKIDIKL